MRAIATTIRKKAKDMLLAGERVRVIAWHLGIDCSTVQRIANRLDEAEKTEDWDGIQPPPLEGPAQFCPVCRVHVRMPCLACQLRARMARRVPA